MEIILWNESMMEIFLYSYYPKLLPSYKNRFMIMKIDFMKYIFYIIMVVFMLIWILFA